MLKDSLLLLVLQSTGYLSGSRHQHFQITSCVFLPEKMITSLAYYIHGCMRFGRWQLHRGMALAMILPITTPLASKPSLSPWPPGQEPTADPKVQSIASAAKELVDKRANWLNAANNDPQEKKKRTLTNLYNQRPTWLDLAHKKLDIAVLDAYGWPHDIADEEILSRLLALNLERAGKGQSKSS